MLWFSSSYHWNHLGARKLWARFALIIEYSERFKSQDWPGHGFSTKIIEKHFFPLLKNPTKSSFSFQNFFQRLEKSLSKSESFEEVRQSICCLNEIAQPGKTFSSSTVMKITQMYFTLALQSDREIAFAFIKRFLTEPNDQEEKGKLMAFMKYRSKIIKNDY